MKNFLENIIARWFDPVYFDKDYAVKTFIRNLYIFMMALPLGIFTLTFIIGQAIYFMNPGFIVDPRLYMVSVDLTIILTIGTVGYFNTELPVRKSSLI